MQILIKWYLQSARVVHYYMTPYSKGFNALLVQDSADGRKIKGCFIATLPYPHFGSCPARAVAVPC